MTSQHIPSDVYPALTYIRKTEKRTPEIGLILGSGLGHLATIIKEASVFPTHQIPGFPHATVAGHKGELIIGLLENRTVALLRGRVHYYEGHPIQKVTFPIRLLYALGISRLLVTNAAGGINPHFVPGDLMFITDHIGLLTGINPLVGPNSDGGPRFPDMSEPYDLAWIEQAEQLALQQHIRTHRGVYLWTTGPSYETKAEIQCFARIGADAVGMSTVPEVIQARYLNMNVLGISAITNRAAGLHKGALTHEEVLLVGQQIRDRFERLVRTIIAHL